MSNKDYDEADGVFDIDGDDADQDLDLEAEETSAQSTEAESRLSAKPRWVYR